MFKADNLRKKGWSEEEIKKAEAILHQTEKHDIYFSRVVFWTAIIAVVIGNLLISVALIPLLLAVNKTLLYLTIIIFALLIGFLYNFLIRDIGHLERKHHLLAGVIIPLIALFNIFLVTSISNLILKNLRLENLHHPLIPAIVFAFFLMVPYLTERFLIKK